MTGKSTYSHQYMSNAEAPKSEGYKVYLAYKSMEDYDDMTVTFSIPVFDNMPDKASSEPALVYNPNAYLKTLSVKTGDGTAVTLSPSFSYGTLNYTAKVSASVKSVTISGITVSSLAKITAGTGTVTLTDGENVLKVTVKAQNGSTKTYTITITKG